MRKETETKSQIWKWTITEELIVQTAKEQGMRRDGGIRIEFAMPEDTLILSCQTQHNKMAIWGLVKDTSKMGRRGVRVYGTGQNMIVSIPMHFIGTCVLNNGSLVLHLWEESWEGDK